MDKREQEAIRIGSGYLLQHVDWSSVVARVTYSVNHALYNGKSPVVEIPQYLYDIFLGGWACAYLDTPFALPRHRPWIDKVLRWFGIAIAKREMTLQVSNEALRQLYGEMVERESLIVHGTYIPVVQLKA